MLRRVGIELCLKGFEILGRAYECLPRAFEVIHVVVQQEPVRLVLRRLTVHFIRIDSCVQANASYFMIRFQWSWEL